MANQVEKQERKVLWPNKLKNKEFDGQKCAKIVVTQQMERTEECV
jgi:hypothetical protein